MMLWLAVAAALAASGCANCRLPRIDPTGERLFIWNPPPTPPPTFGAAPPPLAQPLSGTTTPVLPGAATLPYPAAEGTTATPIPSLGTPGLAAPGLPGAVPTPGAPVGLPTPGLSVSPSQIVAPIGSEVVMVATVMGDGGYPLTREKVEWMLDANGPGQFVSPGSRRPWEILHCLHRYPEKVTPTYAINRTLTSPHVIDRGTPIPSDDITVADGQAWVSVSSPSEGTSHVTAFAPNVKGWDRRQQSATIYWVDAQWRFPPPAITPVGGRNTFTTFVTRQSDSSPLAGWVVRYEIAGGPAAGFAPDGSTSVEVVTNVSGEAPAEIFQQRPTPGTNQISIQVIRPATAETGSLRVPVGSGTTMQTWTSGDATAPYSPPVQGAPTFVPVTPGGTPTPAQPPATTPPTTQPPVQTFPVEPPSTTSPPATQPPVAEPATPEPTTPVPTTAPELSVTINTPPLAVVGSDAQFEIEVRNAGTATATGLLVKDQFDEGLEHSSDPTKRAIERNLTDLHPGETTRLAVTFRITRAGELCQDVTVTALNSDPVTARACVTATESPLPPEAEPQAAEPAPIETTPIEPAPIEPTEPEPAEPEPALPQAARPQLSVIKRGPDQATVGETVLFEIEVANNTDRAFQDVVIADNHEISLEPVRATGGSEWLPAGTLGWRLATLNPGQTVRRQIELRCLRETPRACNRVTVTARDMESVADEACVEVVTDQVAPPAEEQPAGQPNLKVTAVETADPIRVNGQTTYQIILTNEGEASVYDVTVDVAFGPELQLLQHGGPVRGSATNEAVRYPAIRELRAGETQTFDLRFKGVASGTARVTVEVKSRGKDSPLSAVQTTEVLP